MSKKQTNEGLFSASKRFSDAFFDGLSKNASDRVIQKAKKAGMPKDAIDVMNNIKKEKDYLDSLLKKYDN
ncbi:YebC/PmpR family DNA-binding transcriptional regulator [bacterium]|nr:YebC/PmpR family DNA-binding transcriptional regulator [bacterium]